MLVKKKKAKGNKTARNLVCLRFIILYPNYTFFMSRCQSHRGVVIWRISGISLMVKRKISNLSTGVRFPYPAHLAQRADERGLYELILTNCEVGIQLNSLRGYTAIGICLSYHHNFIPSFQICFCPIYAFGVFSCLGQDYDFGTPIWRFNGD